MEPINVTLIVEQAIQNLQSGYFDQAKLLFLKIVAIEPENANNIHFIGVIACQYHAFHAAHLAGTMGPPSVVAFTL